MKEESVTYTCDHCGLERTITKGNYSGSILENKWCRMYIKVRPIDEHKTKLHFCSEYCCEMYLYDRRNKC